MDDHDRQLLVLGREHYQRGEFEKAEYLLEQLVVRADRFADVHHMLGVIAHHRGQFVRAEGYFEKALRINPEYTEAQLNLMVTYNELGKYDAARRVYALVRARADQSTVDPFIRGKIANMHAELSQAYHDAHLLPEAIRELRQAVALCPLFADLQVRLGLLCREVGDIALAREHLEAARTANPRYVQGRLSLGTLLLSMGEREEARREFETALELEPENRTAQMYLRLVASTLRNLPPDTVRDYDGEPSPEMAGRE